ncbi:hypothetical protein [Alkaliphilus crotonatoxidans]
MKPLNDTYYLAESAYIPKNRRKEYIQYLKLYYLPRVEAWKQGGLIKNQEVYQYLFKNIKKGSFLSWNHLKLMELNNRSVADQVIEELGGLPKFQGKELIRRELLVSTPNSNYPEASPQARQRSLPLFFAIEYVDVYQPHLDEFRQIMIHNNGPAMKYIMMERKWCYNFIALETVEIFRHNPLIPGWNQLHVIGLYPDAVLSYKKDFEAGLKEATGISFEENFNRLKQIRAMLYKTGNKRLKLT